MKRPLKHYAIALYEAVKTPQMKLADVCANFAQILHDEGVLTKAEKILDLFRNYWNRQEREIDIVLTSAHELPSALQKKIGEEVQQFLRMEHSSIRDVVDPSLGGGIIIRAGDTVMDGSVRRQLQGIKKVLQE